MYAASEVNEGNIAGYQYPHQAVAGWGSSGLINSDWVPPMSVLGTPNTSRDPMSVNVVLLLMTLCWIGLNYTLKRRLSAKFSAEYISRIISFIHAGLSTTYCLYAIFLRYLQFNHTSEFIVNMCCLPEPPLADEQFAALFTASYFLADTLYMVFGSHFDTLFMLHHAGALVILFTSLYGRIMGLEVTVGVAILECTNMQLHGRWLLMESKYDVEHPRSWLWWCCDAGFLLCFFVARMIVGTTASVSFLFCQTAPIHISLVTFLYLVASGKFLVENALKIRRGERWTA